MLMQGQFLKFDVVSLCGDVFHSDCQLNFPERVPLLWEFDHRHVIGHADIKKNDDGLYALAELTSDAAEKFMTAERRIGAGGHYTNVKTHNDGAFLVVDSATLRSVSLVVAPAQEACSFEVVDIELPEELD